MLFTDAHKKLFVSIFIHLFYCTAGNQSFHSIYQGKGIQYKLGSATLSQLAFLSVGKSRDPNVPREKLAVGTIMDCIQ